MNNPTAVRARARRYRSSIHVGRPATTGSSMSTPRRSQTSFEPASTKSGKGAQRMVRIKTNLNKKIEERRLARSKPTDADVFDRTFGWLVKKPEKARRTRTYHWQSGYVTNHRKSRWLSRHQILQYVRKTQAAIRGFLVRNNERKEMLKKQSAELHKWDAEREKKKHQERASQDEEMFLQSMFPQTSERRKKNKKMAAAPHERGPLPRLRLRGSGVNRKRWPAHTTQARADSVHERTEAAVRKRRKARFRREVAVKRTQIKQMQDGGAPKGRPRDRDRRSIEKMARVRSRTPESVGLVGRFDGIQIQFDDSGSHGGQTTRARARTEELFPSFSPPTRKTNEKNSSGELKLPAIRDATRPRGDSKSINVGMMRRIRPQNKKKVETRRKRALTLERPAFRSPAEKAKREALERDKSTRFMQEHRRRLRNKEAHIARCGLQIPHGSDMQVQLSLRSLMSLRRHARDAKWRVVAHKSTMRRRQKMTKQKEQKRRGRSRPQPVNSSMGRRKTVRNEKKKSNLMSQRLAEARRAVEETRESGQRGDID